MASKIISEGVYWVGVDDYRDILFEGLWPIPNGVSYNSYIVRGNGKVALIDTVDRYYAKDFITNIKEVVEPSNIEYIVLNHLEPDHSGALDQVLQLAPNARVVGSQIAINIAKEYYTQRFESIQVSDGETLQLGGRTLKFFLTPWLHWPETIFTYIVEDQVLFSGDAFGTFGALNGKLFDDQIDLPIMEMKRYFADIVSHYSKFVIKAGEKIKDLPIKTLCTTHGPAYRKDPIYPIKKYLEWSSDKDENKVLIIYGSMYEHTKELADYFEENLKAKNIPVKSFDLSRTHPSYVLTDLIDAKAVLIGTPAYEGTIFPLVTNMLEYMRIKGVRSKPFGVFANFSWGSN
ncbi:MAG: FprA family A-type flavoprotein, partial [Nitrososphaeria archaeon]